MSVCMHVLLYLCQDWFCRFLKYFAVWLLFWGITKRKTDIWFQPWCNPLRLTRLKAPTYKQNEILYKFLALYENGCKNTHDVLKVRFQVFPSLGVWVKLHPPCIDWKASFVVCLLLYLLLQLSKTLHSDCLVLRWQSHSILWKWMKKWWSYGQKKKKKEKKKKRTSVGAIYPQCMVKVKDIV